MDLSMVVLNGDIMALLFVVNMVSLTIKYDLAFLSTRAIVRFL